MSRSLHSQVLIFKLSFQDNFVIQNMNFVSLGRLGGSELFPSVPFLSEGFGLKLQFVVACLP